MRKISLFIASVLLACTSIAQISDADKSEALRLVNANKATIGLSDADLENLLVSSSYMDNTTATRYVYLQQSYKGIPVYNQLQVLTFKSGQLLSIAGGRISFIEQKVNTPNGIPAVSPSSAVVAAIADRNLTSSLPAIVLGTKDNGRIIEFNDLGISQENITAQLIWYPHPEGKMISLAWQIYIIPKTTPDHWLVRIDAVNSLPLGADNLTVYCNWDDPHKKESGVHELTTKHQHHPFLFQNQVQDPIPALADNVNYRVIPFPAEAPSFQLGAHAVQTNPWTAATANASTLKWHSTAVGTDYNYTRGNNVWAYHDRTNLNTGDPARSATSTTALPNLNFDFTPNYTLEPVVTSPAPNQQFNITNLFYWNNVIHDVMYGYGFDEVSGNFQSNNLGRGGLGNDYVRAEAQDGGGTNNANFFTPPDGSLPRMQMYLWTAPTPDRDGDVDNGIIVHEYGHGISNRLTGGPATTSCLSNEEQMGEGWSDYYTLMFTQDWASSNLNTGFTIPRGIGTYALNQPTTGAGIRTQRYCTDFSINNRAYAITISSSAHTRGEIWCATLWDMTWNIIQQTGTINPNIYNVAGGGGNVIALRLITEGMKLQPCSPGFIDGRNAILQADLNLYGGAYQCAIKEAFRRRGMGDDASQGSSYSVTDQVPSFTSSSATLTLLQNGTSTPEGQDINYTNRLVVGSCGDLVNYSITDTLPANVSFVSVTNGGTYNAASRVVSWTVNQAANTTVDYNFVVNINAGAYYPAVTVLNETVTTEPPTLPAGWSTTADPNYNPWESSNSQSHSAPNSFFTPNLETVNDQILVTTNSLSLPASPLNMSFWGYIDSEEGWDGGVVEISTDGGGSWSDLGPNMISGGYTGPLNTSGNPLSERPAFHGYSGGFFKTTVDLSPYVNQANVKFRFRFGSDELIGWTGWWVDDILIEDVAQVNMRSSLFNASAVRLSFSDATMLITAPGGCVPPSVNQHPANSSVCAGGNTSFTVAAFGSAPLSYQWEESTSGAGGPWNNIANGGVYVGAATATLTLTGVSLGMSGYQYRCVVTGQCAPTATSNAAVLTVSNCEVPTVTCPANINASVTTGCNISIAVPNPTITNTTTLTWVMTGATTGNSGNTGINYVGTRTFNIGTTTISYTATNAGASSATCSFSVTVNTPATITCPANISTTLRGKYKCSISLNIPNPNISGNCSVTKLVWVMTGALTLSSPATGINYVGTQTFPVGITTVTYTVTNGANNTATCSFTVTVRNNKCAGSPPFTEPVTGIEKPTDELTVKVSPNPGQSWFTLYVQSGSNEKVEIAVYSITGRLMQKLNGNVFESFRFGDSYLPGTYIVRVKQGVKEVTVKLVK